jgi:hypothetical protein
MSYGTSSSEDRRFSEFIGEYISLEGVLQYISMNFTPEQVFENKQLEEWARDNNFVHMDDKS